LTVMVFRDENTLFLMRDFSKTEVLKSVISAFFEEGGEREQTVKKICAVFLLETFFGEQIGGSILYSLSSIASIPAKGNEPFELLKALKHLKDKNPPVSSVLRLKPSEGGKVLLEITKNEVLEDWKPSENAQKTLHQLLSLLEETLLEKTLKKHFLPSKAKDFLRTLLIGEITFEGKNGTKLTVRSPEDFQDIIDFAENFNRIKVAGKSYPYKRFSLSLFSQILKEIENKR